MATVINTATTGNQSPPVITALDDGRTLYTWAENGASDVANMQVIGRIMNVDGTPSTAQFQIGTWSVDGSDGYDLDNLTVKTLTGGNVVVGYVRNFLSAGGIDEPVFSIINTHVAPGSPGFAVATNVEIQQTDTTTYESPPVIEALDDGRFIAVWSKDGLSDDSTTMKVQGRIFDPNGTPSTNEFQVGTWAVDGTDWDDISSISVKQLAGGNVVVGYVRSDAEVDNTEPVMSIIDPSKTPGTPGFAVATNVEIYPVNTAGTYLGPPLVQDLANGQFMTLHNQIGPTNSPLIGRIFNADGTAATSHFTIGTYDVDADNNYNWDNASITQLANGNVVVAYVRASGETGGTDPVFSIINPSIAPGQPGFQVATDVQMNTDTVFAGGAGTPPVIATFANGSWVAVWEQSASGTDGLLYAKIYSKDGTVISGPTLISNGGTGSQVDGFTGFDWDSLSVIVTGPATYTVGWVGNDVSSLDGNGTSVMASGPITFLNGIVEGTTGADYIDVNYTADPQGDRIDFGDGIGYAGTVGDADYVLAGAGNDTVVSGLGADIVYGGVGNDSVFAGAGNDSLFGGDDADQLQGQLGKDTIYGDAGNDSLYGGSDADSVYGGDGDDWVQGGQDALSPDDGNDLVDGGAGNDTLFGELGNDTLYGGTGNDSVLGGLGKDTLYGDTENDTLYGGSDADTVYGGGGDDWVQGGQGTAITDDKADLLFGGIGKDTVFGEEGNDTLFGDADADTLYGGTGNDSTQGGSGNDSVFGGAGNDRAYGGADADSVYGGDGNDLVQGSDGVTLSDDGNDLLYGGLGTDTVLGDSGDDMLYGNDGTDALNGGVGADTLDGGAGIDTLTGGTGPDVFIADGTADLVLDFDAITGISGNGHLDNDFVDLSAFYNETTLATWNAANPTNKFSNPLSWLRWDQENGVLQAAGGLTIQNAGTAVSSANLSAENTNVICFASGTRIRTIFGDTPIEDLEVGDLVLTLDNGYKPILWIGSQKVEGKNNLAPIRFETGVLMNDEPLFVSPQHRVRLKSNVAKRLFGTCDVIVAAKHLICLDGICQVEMAMVEYFHFLLDQHELVFSNGAATETLFTGPEALKAVSPEARAEIRAIFPMIGSAIHTAKIQAVRPIVNGRKGGKLALRHMINGKPLVSSREI